MKKNSHSLLFPTVLPILLSMICLFLAVSVLASDEPSAESDEIAVSADGTESGSSLSAADTSLTGWINTEDGYIYRSSDGTLAAGLQTINGKTYYFDPGSGLMLTGLLEIDGKLYYFDTNGRMVSGWQKVGSDWYYFEQTGAAKSGWVSYNSSWYYFDPETFIMKTGQIEWEGKYYYLNEHGVMHKGWLDLDGTWYLYLSNGSLDTGWDWYNGYWYYFDPDSGAMQTGWLELDGKTYYLNANGRLQTGWLELDGQWYYLGSNGVKQTGWTAYNGRWYYLDPDTGVMQTGWLEWSRVNDDGEVTETNQYYLRSSGAMVTGWIKLDGQWYYFGSNGVKQTGWTTYNGHWYYLDPDTGVMQTGWLEWSRVNDDGEVTETNRYYLRSSGAMVTGWIKLGDFWYYMRSNGTMATGWITYNGYRYYLYLQDDPYGGQYGTMAHDTEIDGQKLLSSGHPSTSTKDRMYNFISDMSSSSSYIIAVDINSCHVGIYTGSKGNWTLKYYWQCSPGASSTPTVTGTFTVGTKGYYFDSGSARCYYYTQFCGNYLFHSVLYTQADTHAGQVSDGRLGMNISHGCVRLAIGNAKWIYNNIPKGTTVRVYK